MDHTASIARLAIALSAAFVVGMAVAAARPNVQAAPGSAASEAASEAAAERESAREPALYVLHAGVRRGPLTVNEFLPATLHVHPGDQVQWQVTGPHNIHFVPAGETVERVGNLLDATIADGAAFTGGNANSGLQANVPAFTLVMDVEPGIYDYQCDIHPGMTGSIEVLDASASIPSPEQVATDLAAALAASNRPAGGRYGMFSGVATPVSGD